MDKTIRYNYNGHNIIVRMDNHSNNNTVDRWDTDIYIDGELLPRTKGEPGKIQFELSSGEKCEFIYRGRDKHLLVNGARQDEFRAQKTIQLNLDNMRALAKLKPITALSEYDFWAIKYLEG